MGSDELFERADETSANSIYIQSTHEIGCLVHGRKGVMRTLFEVFVIDKVADTFMSKEYIIAEDSEEARIKVALKLKLEYDSRVYMICPRAICSWRLKED